MSYLFNIKYKFLPKLVVLRYASELSHSKGFNLPSAVYWYVCIANLVLVPDTTCAIPKSTYLYYDLYAMYFRVDKTMRPLKLLSRRYTVLQSITNYPEFTKLFEEQRF